MASKGFEPSAIQQRSGRLDGLARQWLRPIGTVLSSPDEVGSSSVMPIQDTPRFRMWAEGRGWGALGLLADGVGQRSDVVPDWKMM
jgi:hypothetical protein